MEQKIDKTDIEGQLTTLITNVINSYRNRTAKKHFYNAINGLKPKSCLVKCGWRAGEYFSVVCKFEKNGESDVLQEIIKNFPDKTENLYFLYGLYPEVFSFDPLYVLDEPNFLTLSFKLQKPKKDGKKTNNL